MTPRSSEAANSATARAALRGLVPVRSARLYEQVIDALSAFVEAADLGPERRFPPERDLERELRVSRPVLREAFRVLEMHGYVQSRQGGGRYLVRSPLPNSRALRLDALTASRENLMALWQARELIECCCARLAAEHAGPQQIEEIRRPLQLLQTLSPQDYRATDNSLQFHLAIARASGNPFFERLISDLVAQARAIGFKDLISPERFDALQDDHRPILEAIVARNPVAAERAMHEHFDGLRRALSSEATPD